MQDWKKEFDKQESFEFGIPVVYQKKDEREVSGEVVLNREPHRNRNGVISKPGTKKGISLYRDKNYSGDAYRFIVPDSWFYVKRFSEVSKEYVRTHRTKKALNSHLTKIKARGGKYSVKGMEITYSF